MLTATEICYGVSQADLQVRREDIDFYNVAPDRLRIDIGVRNGGEAPSRATLLELASAPLGAFLPWQLLAVLTVPSIAPGKSVTVSTEVGVPPTPALGDRSRMPPGRLRTAVGAEDGPQRSRAESDLVSSGVRSGLRGSLAPDLLRQLGRPSVHWAGNLNVFIQGRAVERHLAKALRIYAGHTNLAMFMVGSGPEAYRFDVEVSEAFLEASIQVVGDWPLIRPRSEARQQVAHGEWVECQSCLRMILGMRAPKLCRDGEVRVLVDQRSTGKSTIVEFSLDASAGGPGCYTV